VKENSGEMKKRAVITGLGVIAPNGIGEKNFWDALMAGRNAIHKITQFDVSQCNSQMAGWVADFDPRAFGLKEEEIARMDRYVQFALAGTHLALDDSGLDLKKENKERIGVSLGNAICGTRFMEEEFLRVADKGRKPIDPSLVRSQLYDASMFNTPSLEISARYGTKGICQTISTGCTAGTDSVACAYESIQDGEADIIITGATEAPLTPITMAAFDVIGAISKRSNDPEHASRPFDKERDGFVVAEGCAILILEEREHAQKRQAPIYAEVIGFGTTTNAYHMTDIPSGGLDIARAIKIALGDAGVKPEDIGYINAHGSSTQQNDLAETNAFKAALGKTAYKIPISSTKSMIGHSLAAANSIELAACALSFRNNYLHPTINYEIPDPGCDLDYIPNKPREKKVDVILKTSSSFSGIHSAILLGRHK
jgi:beta-ketoacyl-acyl-carrier-protein synthase II